MDLWNEFGELLGAFQGCRDRGDVIGARPGGTVDDDLDDLINPVVRTLADQAMSTQIARRSPLEKGRFEATARMRR